MADQILSQSDILRRGERVSLYISGSSPLFIAPSAEEVRAVIDSSAVGAVTFSGEVLELSNLSSLLRWYRIDVEVDTQQSVGQLRANVASVVDSNLMTYWNVQVSEVRKPGNSIGDILSSTLPEVPYSTAASLVAVAVLAVVVILIVN